MIQNIHRVEGRGRGGFTLLEVLLTVLLSMILLAGLWSLSNIYLRTFERGQDLVEQAQLLRAVQQQVNDDLQALAVRPRIEKNIRTELGGEEGSDTSSVDTGTDVESKETAGDNPTISSDTFGGAGTTTLPVYSLSGTETSLKLILLREVFTTENTDEEALAADFSGESTNPRLPGWRVVQYQFVPRDEDASEEVEADDIAGATGLSRREIAWEDLIGSKTADDLLMQTPDPGGEEIGGVQPTEMPEEAGLEAPLETEEEREALEGKEERIDLPQILACRFRYYDGSMWQSHWESSTSRELPVAVELMLQIEPTGAAQRERLREEQESTAEAKVEDEENTVLQEPKLETKGDWPIYRQVFFLTNGGRAEQRRGETLESSLPPTTMGLGEPFGEVGAR